MNLRKVLIAGGVGGVVNAVYSFLVCNHLVIPLAKRVTPPDFWVPETGLHTLIMIVYSFAICILWAFGYALLYRGLPGSGLSKGVLYGFLLWLLGVLPNTVALHLVTNIWPEFNWVFLSADSLGRWVILGVVYGAIYRAEEI